MTDYQKSRCNSVPDTVFVMTKRFQKKIRPGKSEESTGWWGSRGLSHFDPLISFANEGGDQGIPEERWRHALWEALGPERFSWVTYKTNEGVIKKERIQEGEIASHVSMEVGEGWIFPADKEQEIKRAIDEAIIETEPDLPKISDQEPTFALVKQLQTKVRRLLDCIIEKISLVESQRSRPNGFDWRERVRKKDVGLKLTGHESASYQGLPWNLTHFEESREMKETIQREFHVTDGRPAIVDSTGFLLFDDEGTNAAVTLAWMIYGLLHVAFKKERLILKKCRWCNQYFVHETRHKKQFCTDNCRYSDHNKGLHSSKK